MRTKKSWNVKPSQMAENTVNPIRSIIENMKINPNPDKSMISLTIGDPTVFGNLAACEETTEAVIESIRSMRYNGYAPTTGYYESREAIAEYSSRDDMLVKAEDVIITSGCSHALDMCISVLANPGQNILIPRPGFSIYRTLAESLGIETKSYDLMPDTGWQVDLEHLESQIDSMTAAIIINNPSNPCGSVYPKRHLRAILEVARRNFVPIIADEIYEEFVFKGEVFYPLASLSDCVPILSCSGLTKRFLVPGWRVGWLVIHDRNNIFGQKIRAGLQALSQKIIGSNTIVQGAIPDILTRTPSMFFQDTVDFVQRNAELSYAMLSKIPGLFPTMPSGAMYMMVGISKSNFPTFKHDMDFVECLMAEQSVFCLPGQCFDYPFYFRVVLTVPEELMVEACKRIKEFCTAHYARNSTACTATMIVTRRISLAV